MSDSLQFVCNANLVFLKDTMGMDALRNSFVGFLEHSPATGPIHLWASEERAKFWRSMQQMCVKLGITVPDLMDTETLKPATGADIEDAFKEQEDTRKDKEDTHKGSESAAAK